ncbi:hypothetical protein [Escherichia coli]|uniref:hypothetical protein n=1 Tax=Escherichia coli TaxID=562 RepID=UPI00227FCA81|nr:hypothetical protein [Escherichia coli]MCZ0231505.1 hypothetical protein [Escherichia coli]MCZ0343776.1 hypothetical protein [Escherichia coli]MCZ0358077.1 hypothetical protein [Escherichia coli]
MSVANVLYNIYARPIPRFLPLTKLMFYKEFFPPILFGGQISGAKIRFSGAIIGISGAKMRGKITVSQNFRGKNSGFQGQKWDSEI